MFTIQIFFIFTFVLTLLNMGYIILKKKEFKDKKLTYLIGVLLIISIVEFFLNVDVYLLSNASNSLETPPFSSLILPFILSSLCLFIYSFFIRDQDVIELDCPSLFRSRLGKIENRGRSIFYKSIRPISIKNKII